MISDEAIVSCKMAHLTVISSCHHLHIFVIIVITLCLVCLVKRGRTAFLCTYFVLEPYFHDVNLSFYKEFREVLYVDCPKGLNRLKYYHLLLLHVLGSDLKSKITVIIKNLLHFWHIYVSILLFVVLRMYSSEW